MSIDYEHLWNIVRGYIKSFVAWFNGIAATVAAGLPMVQDSLPQLKPYINGPFYSHLLTAVIVGNILLRFKTKDSLAAKGMK